MLTGAGAVAITGLVKEHGGLRPLRLTGLAVETGEIVSVLGFDAAQAEVVVGLVTGAMLPDEGEVRVFGVPTTALETPEQWLDSLDRIGLVSTRIVLLDELSVAQNIAVPLTLDLDPLAGPVRDEVRRLAADAAIDGADLDRSARDVSQGVRVRTHLARALALKPRLLLLEHASATLAPHEATAFAAAVARVSRGRGLSILALTGDERFARRLGGRRLSWLPATGEVRTVRGWPRGF